MRILKYTCSKRHAKVRQEKSEQWREGQAHLGAPLGEELEVALEVRGEDELDEEEAEAAQLRGVQVAQPEELGARAQQAPRTRCVVVLQHRPVVVQDRLHQPTPQCRTRLMSSIFKSKPAYLNTQTRICLYEYYTCIRTHTSGCPMVTRNALLRPG